MTEILSLLGAAVLAVLIFSRLGFGAILGYLVAGAIIGPSALALVTEPDNIRHIGEFGVVFLLFLIGIEIKPARLWVMRKLVFGLGGLQVMITGILIGTVCHMGFGLSMGTSTVVGFGFALSSTAFGIQIMADKNQLSTHWGRAGFSILLLQDLAVVPLIALVSLLAAGGMDFTESMGLAVLESTGIFLVVLIIGRFAVNPMLRAIAQSRSMEAFRAAALLLVLGTAFIMEHAGLSMAMGAFIAGMLLADSEFRHQVEADVEPFRGLLLGVFFMSVGMSIELGAVWANLTLVIFGALALMVFKALIIFGLARTSRLDTAGSIRAAVLLSQAGEFGFVLFSLADTSGVLPSGLLEPLLSIIVLSMAATPIATLLGERLADRLCQADALEDAAQENALVEEPVIIAGFGRVGQTIADMLTNLGKPWLAIDMSTDHIAQGRAKGQRVYYGNAGSEEILRAVGLNKAKLMVITLDNPKAAERTIRQVKKLSPQLPLIVRARDTGMAEIYQDMGATHVVPETLEASLSLAEASAQAIGVQEDQLLALKETMRSNHYAKLKKLEN